MKRLCINIGAGNDIQKSDEHTTWLNLDKCQEPGIDVIRDIEKQCLPFGDSTVDHIHCGDVLEHIHDLVFVMNELWRILKPGGRLHISTPYGEVGWQHPTHVRIFFPQSWAYFDGNDPVYKHMRKSEGIKADFQIVCSERRNEVNLWTELVARKNTPDNFVPIYTNTGLAIPNNVPGAVKLDIGCGTMKRDDTPGWIGVDQDPCCGADIVCDLEKGLPFPDSSVDFIYTSHALEHVHDLIAAMEEFYRVLKKDGLLEIVVPVYNSDDAYRHPDHKRFMHPQLWMFWSHQSNQADRDSYGVKAWFEIVHTPEKVLNYVHVNGLFTTLRKVIG